MARVSLVVVSATALVLGSALVSASAAAPETEILMSSDGVSFAPTLDTALFDDVGVMVPQDVDTMSFWIRNPTSVPVEMRVSVSTLAADSVDVASNLTLTARDAGTGAVTTSALSTLSRCYVVVKSRTIAPAATMQVDLSLEMLDVTGQIAQNGVGSMDLLVAMRDGEAGAFPPSACDDTGVLVPLTTTTVNGASPLRSAITPSSLAYTGMTMHYDWFAISAGALGFGFLMLLRRRREEQ